MEPKWQKHFEFLGGDNPQQRAQHRLPKSSISTQHFIGEAPQFVAAALRTAPAIGKYSRRRELQTRRCWRPNGENQ